MRGILLLTGLILGMQTIPAPAHAYDAQDLEKLRKTGNCEGCDLRAADLSGRNLLGANLRGAYMHRANLRGAKLQNADLSNADLTAANLREADLRDAILTGTQLNDSNLAMTNLRGANIRDAELFETTRIATVPANDDPVGSGGAEGSPAPPRPGGTEEHGALIDPRPSADTIYELDFQPASHTDGDPETGTEETSRLVRFFGRFLSRW